MGGRDRPAEHPGAKDGTVASQRLATESGRHVSDLPESPCGRRHAPALGREEITKNCGIAPGGGRHGAGPALHADRVALGTALRILGFGIDDDFPGSINSGGWMGESERTKGQMPLWIWR